MKTKKAKILAICFSVLLVASLATAFAIVGSASENAPAVEIAGKNITFEESTALKFAVSVENAGENEPKLLVWTEAQDDYSYNSAAAEEVEYIGTGVIEGNQYDQFKFPVFAKQMTDVFYFRAYVEIGEDVEYSEVLKYSVLDYAYDRLLNSENANLKALLTATLKQGAAAQSYKKYKSDHLATDDWRQVRIFDNLFADGTDSYLALVGDTFALAAPNLTSPTWASSDPNVVTVNGGVITVVGSDTSIITATSGNNSVSFTVSISEPWKPVLGAIVLNANKINLSIGQSATLVATVYPSGTNEEITWTSDSEAIKIENGVVTALAPDSAIITATTSSGAIAQCKVTCNVIDTNWNFGYVQVSGKKIAANGNRYSYTNVITIPKAGTTVTFIDNNTNANGDTGFISASAYVFSSWTKNGDEWTFDSTGTHIRGAGANASDNAKLITDEEGNVTSILYSYTTTNDNENIRLCYLSGQTSTFTPSEYPEITFIEGSSITFHQGYVGSMTNNQGYVNKVADYAEGKGRFHYSDVVTIPNKGTTISFVSEGKISTAAYVFSSWVKVGGEWVIDLTEPNLSHSNEICTEYTTKDGRTMYLYSYTTYKDNENIRITRSVQHTYYNTTPEAVNLYYTPSQIHLIPAISIVETDRVGNFAEAAADIQSWKTASKATTNYTQLEGITMNVIGDSYFQGSQIPVYNTWPTLLAEKYNMVFDNHGRGGSSIGNLDPEKNPMVDRYQYMPDNNPNIVLVEGGRNDYNVPTPIGTNDDTDTKTFKGAVNTMIDGMKEKYPNALIIFVTCWNVSKQNSLHVSTADYATAMKEVCEARGVVCFDASDIDATGVNMNDADFRAEYCQAPNDVSHLNVKGHRYVLPVFEKFIAEEYSKFLAK